MRRRGLSATDHAEVADDAPCCAWCRTIEPPCDCEAGADEWMREALRCLAGNLRVAGALAYAWRLHRNPEWWRPNLDGKPAPGWES